LIFYGGDLMDGITVYSFPQPAQPGETGMNYPGAPARADNHGRMDAQITAGVRLAGSGVPLSVSIVGQHHP
jgi:hypothetical protein